MKRRIIFDDLQIKRWSKLGRIIVLTGARQTGKTTIASNSFADYNYLAVDNPVQADGLMKLTSQQWHTFYPKAVLDEVQKEPTLMDRIKSTHDQFADTRYLFK
jgi:predicted AAA+ superfamily ATPase